MNRIFLAAVLSCLGLACDLHADWMQFRGPGGNAVSDARSLPQRWSDTEGIRWRVQLPGLGTSSPIVVADRILVTCYSGYAESAESPGRMEDLVRHVVCLERESGRQLWQVDIPADLPESRYEGGNNTWHGYSSSTPVSDGQNVYVFFGRTGVFAFDLDGKRLWHRSVGTGHTGWGSAASPVIYRDLVIVNASVESRSLVALDKKTGEERWRVTGMRGCWNTPTLVALPGGGTELVVSLPRKLLALDPATGTERWHCEGIPDEGYVCPSVISHDGIVYAIGGRQNTALAVRAGGQGDVSPSHVLWRVNRGSNVSSPVYWEGHLYWVHERQGLLNCLDAATGATVFQTRIEPRPGVVYASLTAADGKLYAVSQHAGVFVFAAKPEYQLLAHNRIAGDDQRANASPAIDSGRIYLRNDRYLYCIATN